MSEIFQPTHRRTLLKRGLACIAGAMGLKLTGPEPAAVASPLVEPASPVSGGRTTIRFYSRRLQVRLGGAKPGLVPAPNGRVNSRCDLLESADGAKVGDFTATCFSPDSPFGFAASEHDVELQTLKLADGTLFGIGSSGPAAEGERAQAILGGTGRFAGARGSFVIRQNRSGQGEDSFEFLITLLT
jgi:hypothetical protein